MHRWREAWTPRFGWIFWVFLNRGWSPALFWKLSGVFFFPKNYPKKSTTISFFSPRNIHKKYTEGKLLDRKWPPHFGNARNLFGLKMTLNTTHPFGKSPKKILRICGSKLPLLINTDIEGIFSKIKCYALSPAPPDSGFEMLIIHLKQGHLWFKYSVGSGFWCRERKL